LQRDGFLTREKVEILDHVNYILYSVAHLNTEEKIMLIATKIFLDSLCEKFFDTEIILK